MEVNKTEPNETNTIFLACTKTWNAGMPERRNAGILKPRTQNY